jgi:hypothetical protein
MSPAAPWAELADLAEAELALARQGRWEELAACADERVRRAAELGPPPEQARAELQRLAALQDALLALVASARSATLHELGTLRRRRATARGYAAAAPRPAGRIDGVA